MVNKFIRFFVFFVVWSGALLAAGRPQVCLNMIVKDEKEVIERCLNSVKPLIDYWVIVDTGSKDGTQEVIRQCLKGIPGKLYERPWVNFAHNRNEAMSFAKDKAEYLLFIDADDILTYADGFKKPALDKDLYTMQIDYGGTSYSRAQLVKSGLNWKWEGVVHEGLYCPDFRTSEEIEGVRMKIIGGGDRSQDSAKFLKDALLLEAALKENPQNPRNVFYLAYSYRDAGIHELALKNFQKRVEMKGWDQEVFWSLYQIGLLHQRMGHSSDEVVKALTKAFQYRPSRAEPLYQLAAHYRHQDNFLLAYLVGKFALSIPLSSDGLFVEKWIYDYGMLFEYSIAAYWVGEYLESFNACTKLLQQGNLPEEIKAATERNLRYAEEKLVQVFAPSGLDQVAS